MEFSRKCLPKHDILAKTWHLKSDIHFLYFFLGYKDVNSNDNILKPTGAERLLKCWQNDSTEKDGRKLKNIYISLILKKNVVLVLIWWLRQGKISRYKIWIAIMLLSIYFEFISISSTIIYCWNQVS